MVALRTGKEQRDEVMGVLNPRTEDHVWIGVDAVPLFRPGGETPFQVYTTFKDVTKHKRVEHALRERVKELSCLHAVSSLVERNDMAVGDIMQGVAELIPPSWQYPEVTCARIDWAGRSFTTGKCDGGKPVSEQSSDIVAGGEVVGKLIVRYLERRPPADEGPFLKEEREMLGAIAQHLGIMAQSRQAREEVERLARFPDENPNPVLRVSDDGLVLYHNSASVPLLEYWRCRGGDALPEKWCRFAIEAIHDGEPRVFEIEYGGETLSLTFAPVVESGFVNVYGLDVTERKLAEQREKQLQARLARAGRMESLSVLAGGIAHDLNNLLGPN